MALRSRAALLALVALLVAAPVVGPTAAAGDSADAGRTAAVQPLSPEDVTFALQIGTGGDARWNVSAEYPLETRNDTGGFEDLGEAFEAGRTTSLGLDSFRTAARRASNATGRQMRVENESRSYAVGNDTGRLTLTFAWTDFARTESGSLYVGDAFNTTDGKWLDSLTARQTLTIEPPAGYDVRSAPVGVVDGVARWRGPETFSGRNPWIVYTGEGTVPTPSTTSPTPTTPSTTPPTTTSPTTTTLPSPTSPTTTAPPTDPNGSAFPLVFAVLLIGVGAAALGAYALRDDDSTGLGEVVANFGGDDGSAGAEKSGRQDDAGAPAAGAAGAAAATDPTVDEDDVDVELLSDAERVERLLDRNSGRMKQANIVKETGWSNAKVSQLLSSMEEEERINKLRIGRENLISFPDEDLADLDEE